MGPRRHRLDSLASQSGLAVDRSHPGGDHVVLALVFAVPVGGNPVDTPLALPVRFGVRMGRRHRWRQEGGGEISLVVKCFNHTCLIPESSVYVNILARRLDVWILSRHAGYWSGWLDGQMVKLLHRDMAQWGVADLAAIRWQLVKRDEHIMRLGGVVALEDVVSGDEGHDTPSAAC